MLRHGGASHDLLHKLRSFEEIKARGQWLTDLSVRRYAKAAAVQRYLLQCPIATVEYGRRALDNLQKIVLATSSAESWAVAPSILPMKMRRKTSLSN